MMDLSAYIPRDRLRALAHSESLPDRANGAVLFADVSGFTPLTRSFAKTLGPKRGAEAILGVLNPLFEALIEPVHRYGGSVIGFAGDAITCWFDAHSDQPPTLSAQTEKASLRAVAAALAMQAELAQFAAINTPGGTAVSLSVKAAIAAGPVRRFKVGLPAIQRIDTLAGSTLARVAAAEKHTGQGEVTVSREVALSLGAALYVSAWRAEDRVAVVGGLAAAVEPSPWLPLPAAMPAELSRQWVLPAVYEQLHSGAGSLGDLRPVTPLMLRFGGFDFDTDDDAGAKLDAFVCWAQQIIHHHGGIVLQLTTGDKGAFIYAPFGAPHAHENDSQRAMQAALALRELPRDLAGWITPLQIGLTRGEVWTGNCGGHGRFTYSVMGSDVNLAARLMSQAKPGQILVSGRMSQYPGFRLQHVGDLTYKGFDQPVPTYSLLGELLSEEHVFSTPMVGRTAELQQLADFAQTSSEGQLAGTAIIYGEPGIGKSRLAYALRQHLRQSSEARGVSWFTGQTDQILRQSFSPFVYWLKGYFIQSTDDEAEQNKARFENRLAHTLTALQSLAVPPQPLISELIRTQSFLGALLGLQWDDSLYRQLDDPKLRYQNTVTAVKTLILAESTLRPVVFELEDGHWLDEASRDLLLTLSRNVAPYPLLIVITSRYHDDGTQPTFALDEEMPTLILDLDVLSRADLEEQAAAILAGPIDPGLLTFLWERSHANPFFVEQILLHFREMSALVQTPAGAWGLEAIPTDLPADVNTMLIARIDRLAQQVKQVVQVAAVLGREFDVQLLSTMLRVDVLPEVQQAEREQIWSLLHELRYIFKHALLRDAAYEMQLRARLRELHTTALAAYEYLYATDLSAHYNALAYHAEQSGDEAKQRTYFSLAGDTAQAAFANEAALYYYGRLLPLLPDTKTQLKIHLKRGAVSELIGKWEDAETAYRAALACATGDVVATARCQQALATLLHRNGDYDDALEWLVQVRDHWAALSDASGVGQAEIELGFVFWRKGDYARAQQHLEAGYTLAREQGDLRGMALALNTMGNLANIKGNYASAQALHEESLALRQALGDKAAISMSFNNLGILAWFQGDNATARDLYEKSLALRKEIGDRPGISQTLNNLGIVASALGSHTEAQVLHEECLAIMRETGNRPGASTSLCNLGQVAVEQGHFNRARALYAESLTLAHTMGDKLLVLCNFVGGAAVAAGLGVAVRAVQFAAAAETLRVAINGTLPPIIRQQYERTITATRAALGEEAFNAAWAVGSRWSLEEAVHEALQKKT